MADWINSENASPLNQLNLPLIEFGKSFNIKSINDYDHNETSLDSFLIQTNNKF